MCGCDAVLIESNYDEGMLRSGPYPYCLKRRIASSDGHLSNSMSAREVRRLIDAGTTRVILGHLSRENNTPIVARNTLERELGGECVAAQCITSAGHEGFSAMKKSMAEAFNSLAIPGLRVDDLNLLNGFYVNLEYHLPNGQSVKLLEDNGGWL